MHLGSAAQIWPFSKAWTCRSPRFSGAGGPGAIGFDALANCRYAAKSRQPGAKRDGNLKAGLGYTTAIAPSEDPPAKLSSGPSMRTCFASV
jgi:hypothetical protein